MVTSEVADLYIILRAVTQPFTEAMAAAGAESEASGGMLTKSFSKAAPLMLGVAGAVTLAGAVSVKWAQDFETQYTRLYTAAGAAKTQVLASRDAMLALGDATGYTGTQIAEALYHPISAGFQMSDALKIVASSAQEAQISGANLDDTTYALSSVMKAFGQNGNDAQNSMALLNAIVGDGDMKFQDFNTSIKNWAPTAAAMGISIQSMGSGLAYLTDRGNTAEEASTRLTMGLTLMSTPSAQAAKLLEGLGVASGDVKAGTQAMTDTLQKAHITQNQLAADLKKPDGLYVALSDLKSHMDDAKISATEADSVYSKIFGGGRSDKAILSLMSNLDQLKQKNDQIGQDATAQKFQQDWKDAQSTTAVQFDKLKATLINLGTQLGEKLLPIVKKFMQYLAEGITWITKHKEALIALAGVITGMVVGALAALGVAFVNFLIAAGPVLAIFAAIGMAAVEIYEHWDDLKKWWNDFIAWFQKQSLLVKAAVLLIAQVVLGPILDIGIAAYEIYKHWDQILSFLKKLGKDLLKWGEDIVKFFEHMWDNVSKWAKGAWDAVSVVVKHVWKDLENAWSDTVHFFERIWNDTGGKLVHNIAKNWDEAAGGVTKEWKHVSDDLSSIWGSLVDIWNGTGGKLVHYIDDAFNWVEKQIHQHWAFISENIHMVMNVISNYVKAGMDTLKTIIRVTWDTIKGVTKIAWDAIKGIITVAWDIISGVVKVALDLIKGILQAAWDIIKGVVKTVWDVITGIINTALDFIKDVLKLFADLFSGRWSKLWGDVKKIFTDLWNNISKLIVTFLKNIVDTVIKAGGDLIKGLVKAIEDGVKTVIKALKDVKDNMLNFFKDVGKWLYQIGKDMIQGLINGVKDMGKAAVSAVKGVGHDIVSGAKSVLKVFSPSQVFHEIGQNVGQGLINGIVSNSGAVASAMGKLTGPVMDAGNNIGLNVNGASMQVTAQGAANPGVINITVQGSVLTDKDLRDVVQTQMLQLGARYSTSYTPYKR